MIKFLIREAVTIALLFSGMVLAVGGVAPSIFHGTLFVAGLTGVWIAVLVTGLNRL